MEVKYESYNGLAQMDHSSKYRSCRPKVCVWKRIFTQIIGVVDVKMLDAVLTSPLVDRGYIRCLDIYFATQAEHK